jgi:Zn-dependent protease
MHAQIVLFDGFDPLDVIAPFEVFHAGAAASGGALTVRLVCAEGPREVVSGTGGLALWATGILDPGHAGLLEGGNATTHHLGLGPRIAHAVEQLFAHERRGTVWRAHGPVPAEL